MMNLAESKEAKYLHNTNPQNYTQKMWMMFYRRLSSAESNTLTSQREEWIKRLINVIMLQFS